MDETILKRINTLMEYYGLTSSAFADKVDVQRSSMSHLVSGRNKPSLDFIQKILNQFSDINPTWLIMGTGPMKQLALFDDSGEPAAPIPLPAPTTSPDTYSKPVQQAFVPGLEQIAPPITESKMPDRPVYAEPVYEKKAPVQETMSREIPLPEPSRPSLSAPVSDLPKEKSASNDKKVTKIVFFYSDNTFETFNPE